jgi:hypothetical protein
MGHPFLSCARKLLGAQCALVKLNHWRHLYRSYRLGAILYWYLELNSFAEICMNIQLRLLISIISPINPHVYNPSCVFLVTLPNW